MLIAALGLALWARQIAEATAISSWLGSHQPSETVWQEMLNLNGYGRISDEHLIHQALRALPLTLDDPGSAWTSEDGSWFAVFLKSDAPVPETLYGFPHSPLPLRWEPLGAGWPGFEAAIKRIQVAAAARKAMAKPAKPATIPQDPRAIRY